MNHKQYLRIRFTFSFILIFLGLFHIRAQQNPQIFINGELAGVQDQNGEVLVPATFEKLGWSDGLEFFVDNVIGYYDNNWGLLSAKNKTITDADYYELWPVHKDLIIASKKGNFSNHLFYGALNSKGNAVVDFKYSSIDKIENLLIVTETVSGVKQYGLLNERNQFLLSPEYQQIDHFNDDVYIFSDFNSKSGLIKKNGKILINPTLDSIGSLNSGYAKIYESGKEGLLSPSGDIVVNPTYKSVTYSGDQSKVFPFNAFTIVNDQNELSHKFECDSIVDISKDYYGIFLNDHITISNKRFDELISAIGLQIIQAVNDKLVLRKEGKYGALDTKGNIFIPMEYDSIAADEGYFYLHDSDGWTVMNKFGRMVTSRSYDDLKPVSDNLIAVKRRGYWGFIDFQGDEAVAHKFDEVTPFTHMTSKVKFLDAYGSINQFGEWICQPVYDEILIHEEGVAEARLGSRIDLVNTKGKVFFQTYNKLRPYDGGFIEETAEGKLGFIMRDGRIVKLPVFDQLTFTSQDSILIAREDNYLSLATKGGDRFYSLSGRFEEVIGISEGFVGIKLDGKYGFVDLEGRLRIANRYDSVKLYSDGMAAFYLLDNWGYIDKDETLRVQPVYDSSFDFIDGKAIVIEKGKYGVIDKDGNYLIDSEYDHITRNAFDSFVIREGNKFGHYDSNAKKVAAVEFSLVEEVSKGRVVVKRRGMYGVLNEQGRFTIPMMYSNIKFLSDGKFMVVEEKTEPQTVSIKKEAFSKDQIK
ncbi:MAG: WG repeat-containing protein [Cyclobacteriaceae bacterium]